MTEPAGSKYVSLSVGLSAVRMSVCQMSSEMPVHLLICQPASYNSLTVSSHIFQSVRTSVYLSVSLSVFWDICQSSYLLVSSVACCLLTGCSMLDVCPSHVACYLSLSFAAMCLPCLICQCSMFFLHIYRAELVVLISTMPCLSPFRSNNVSNVFA